MLTDPPTRVVPAGQQRGRRIRGGGRRRGRSGSGSQLRRRRGVRGGLVRGCGCSPSASVLPRPHPEGGCSLSRASLSSRRVDWAWGRDVDESGACGKRALGRCGGAQVNVGGCERCENVWTDLVPDEACVPVISEAGGPEGRPVALEPPPRRGRGRGRRLGGREGQGKERGRGGGGAAATCRSCCIVSVV